MFVPISLPVSQSIVMKDEVNAKHQSKAFIGPFRFDFISFATRSPAASTVKKVVFVGAFMQHEHAIENKMLVALENF